MRGHSENYELLVERDTRLPEVGDAGWEPNPKAAKLLRPVTTVMLGKTLKAAFSP